MLSCLLMPIHSFSGLFILNSHSLHLSVSVCLSPFICYFSVETVFLRGSAPSSQPHSFLSLRRSVLFLLCLHLTAHRVAVFFSLVTGADYVGLSSFGPHTVCGQGQLRPSLSEQGATDVERQAGRSRGKKINRLVPQK